MIVCFEKDGDKYHVSLFINYVSNLIGTAVRVALFGQWEFEYDIIAKKIFLP